MLEWMHDGNELEVVNGRVVKTARAIYETDIKNIEFISSITDPFSVAKAQKMALKLVKENVRVVGLDCEWDWKNHDDGNLPVMQLATSTVTYVLHQLPRLPPRLQFILESKDIKKVGVAVQGDLDRLGRKYDFIPSGAFDLRQMAENATGERQWSLETMARTFLNLQIIKDDKIRRSKWSDQLSLEQIKYAATDADISLLIHDHFMN